jgi:hypothetical protein
MASRRTLAWSGAGIFLLVALLYLPTLRGGFVYDSIAQVLYSDYIHTPSHWGDVLTLRVVAQDELDRNRPMHLASLMLDAAIWKKEPFGYRLTSVLLHALNAALLFALIAALLERRKFVSSSSVALVAAFGALAFAVHPLVVEAVAEPANREDLLVLLPMLVGLLFIATERKHSPLALNAVLIVASFFAVLAKESGAAVPVVFAVAACLFGSFRRCWPGIVGGAIAVVAFLAASYLWRPQQSGIFINGPAPLAEQWWSSLAIQARIWALQLQQIVWPSNLSAHYTPEALTHISAPIALAVLACVVGAAAIVSRSNRLAALGVAVFVLALLPASNFVPQFHPIADRYLYVPLAGVGMIAAALFASLRGKCSSSAARGLLLVAGLAVLSLEYTANLRRQKVWQTPATLWTDVLRQYPNLAQAHIGMANAHYREGDFAAALVSADDAVRTSSGYWAEPYAVRALCLWRTGQRQEALADFRKAQSLSRAYNNQESMAAALMFSPDQLEALGLLLRGP